MSEDWFRLFKYEKKSLILSFFYLFVKADIRRQMKILSFVFPFAVKEIPFFRLCGQLKRYFKVHLDDRNLNSIYYGILFQQKCIMN